MKEADDVPNIFPLLKKYFGHESFLSPQEEIIKDVLAGEDVFALLPTGGGKSLCYQLPALVLDGLILVVSPLIALMKDQVDGLRKKGIAVAYINSTLSPYEIQKTRSSLLNNDIKILYVAPERLMLSEFLSFLTRLKISLIAIDEAHCISEWGHEFRPAYRQLKVLKDLFPRVPLMALTATAVPEVQADIIALLKLKDPAIYKASFNRKNLVYHVRPKADAYGQLLQYLNGHQGESGIVYCFSQKSTESLAGKLQKVGFRVLPYHAGMDPARRAETQEMFIKDDIDIVVATIAFGMGIDKPDIRFVIHYDLPKNMETYSQETGRAGRDGLQSDCILFFGYGDTKKIEYLIGQGNDEEQKKISYAKLRDMVNFCDSHECRRKALLRYFGEAYEEDNCRSCDNCCRAPRERFDGSEIARKILTCVSQAHEKFGANHIVDILRGSKSRKILQNGHDSLKAYGSGREYPSDQWRSFIRELVSQGYLQIEGDAYPVLKLTEKSYDLLFGGEAIMLTKPAQKMAMARTSHDDFKDGFDGRSDGCANHANSGPDQELFESLRALRRQVADNEGIPPYMVFHDSSLTEMAIRLPGNMAEFRSIEGVGDKKLEKYGDIFLREIDAYLRRCKSSEQESPVSVQGSTSEEMAGTESENSSPEISCPDYETTFDPDPALTDKQETDVEDDLSITHNNIDNSVIERLNRLEQQVEELKLAIGEIKDCIRAARCTDSVPKRTELINQRQKN
jgi:ATP-dependent DNA helicase RecQ